MCVYKLKECICVCMYVYILWCIYHVLWCECVCVCMDVCIYHVLWCVCVCVCILGMGIRLNCLNRSSGELTIDFRLIIHIFILKFTIYRLYSHAVKIEKNTACFLIEIFITR